MAWLGLALAVALVAYNLATNRDESTDAAYLLRNLAAGGVLLLLARAAGLGLDDLGLAPEELDDGWRWGRLAVVGVAVASAVAGALATRVPLLSRLLSDRRADLPLDRLVFHVLVRIPFGTAAFEELAFRGVLLGAFALSWGEGWAVAASSVAFGLWHVGPAGLTARINGREDPDQVRKEVVTAVAVTTLGGIGFGLLRLGSGSLLAPVLAHASINAFGLLVAAVVQHTGGVEPRS
ncbi:MAG: CPBP family intramembrane glutamic endopeptidase [Nitriliruptorales bacterium]|nr:CPBP family intramembrane glutamic endopeptidase [Nitriliruptorales bacterium]